MITRISNLRSIAAIFVLASSTTALAAEDKLPYYLLSHLSDGKFERLYEIPTGERLDTNSPVYKKAEETYSTLPFGVGERARYIITYLGAKGGTAEFIVRNPIKWNDTWAHRITGEVKSADWVKWFIEIHDSVECITEGTTEFGPLRFYINQMENKFRQSKIVSFHKEDKKIRQKTQRKDRPEKLDEFPFDKAQDALGALFYMRTQLASGTFKDNFEFPVFTSEKTWTAVGKKVDSETKKVEGIKHETDVYELKTHFGSSLEQKGKFRIWLTKDERKIPVLIQAEVMFGSVKLELTEWDQGEVDPKKKKVFDPIRTDD